MTVDKTSINGEIKAVNQVLRGYLPIYTLVLIHSVFIALLALVPFLYMMQVSQRVYTSRSWETLGFITLIVVLLLFVWGWLSWLRTNTLLSIGSKVDAELRQNVFKAIHRNHEDNAFRYFADIVTLRNGLSGSFIASVFDAMLSPIFIVVLYIIHPIFGWVCLVYIFAIGALSLVSNRSWRDLKTRLKPLEDKALSFGVETSNRSEAIQSMNVLPGIQKKWEGYQHTAADRSFSGHMSIGILDALLKVLRQAQLIIILGVGAVLYLLDEITTQAAFAAFIVMMRGVNPVLSVVQNWQVVQEIRAAYGRINEMLQTTAKSSSTAPGDLKGALRCENVVLLSDAGQPILRNVSFSIPAGSVLGVVGPSGAGKSSLLKLLAGAQSKYAGNILVDGFPLKQWPLSLIGDARGYLPQEVDLLPGTIWENVARFRDFSESENEKVFAAIRLAGALEVVQSRKNGVEEVLGNGGSPLSGGQRQRLGLARAYLGCPKIVILDEPNSAQDSSGEAAISNAIRHLRDQGSTVVFSSHKANMMELCDFLLVLVDGYVHSFSTKDDILDRLETGGNTLLSNDK